MEFGLQVGYWHKKQNELNKCIVSFNLHLHLELLMCQSSCTHITLVMDSWSSLIQGHLIKFLSLKSESLKLWQISSIRPTVFLVLPSYHLASSCGGSVELAASFHVVKIVFSHLVMSGTLPTWRFSWSKPSPLWSDGWGTVGRCVQIKSITAKQQGYESSGMDSLMDSVSPQMVDELCPGNVKQCLTAL